MEFQDSVIRKFRIVVLERKLKTKPISLYITTLNFEPSLGTQF